MSLDKSLSNLFVFSENQHLISSFFAIIFFVSISFISAVIIMIFSFC